MRGQNALFKIATKQCLRHLMVLEGGGAERFIEDCSEAMLRLLMMLDFDAWGGGLERLIVHNQAVATYAQVGASVPAILHTTRTQLTYS